MRFQNLTPNQGGMAVAFEMVCLCELFALFDALSTVTKFDIGLPDATCPYVSLSVPAWEFQPVVAPDTLWECD